MAFNLGVFFGGRSVEHEVAIISAVQAMQNLDKEKYNIIPVYLTKNGEMLTGDALTDINTYKKSGDIASKTTPVTFAKQDGKLVMLPEKKGVFKSKKGVVIDFAFPIVHGTFCEDGTIQGFFETMSIPYAGCDIISSANGMDKVAFKHIMAANNIPVLQCVTFTSRKWIADKDAIVAEIEDKIGYPVIVKPANLGSSVGIGKASDKSELVAKIDDAANFAPKLLVERAISPLREINCAVVGVNDDCTPSVCEEPVMSDEILSYSDKYLSGGKNKSKSESQGMASLSRMIPAPIDDDKTKEIQDLAKRVFEALGCCGVVRIDFILDGETVYVNEINTIPGSLSFYLYEPMGIKYKELLDRIIECGMKRERERNNYSFSYDTNILENGSFGAKGK